MRFLAFVLLAALVGLATCVPQDFCWKHTKGRGIGLPLHVCPPGLEKDGALCYPKCRDGYTGVGPVCWAKCPADMKDTGLQCQKNTYTRGVGKPLSNCPSGQKKDGALCYPECRSGYKAVGPVCWQECNDGYKDDGATCRRDSHSYGKGCCCVKIFGKKKCCGGCRDGYHDRGCICTKDVHIYGKGSYGRGAGKPLQCGDKEDEEAGLCYPEAKPGYKGVGPVAWQRCSGDTTDTGVACTKNSYGRGAGVKMVCAADEDEDAGLCYKPCPENMKGVGPVCWDSCPSGWAACGAGCGQDKSICASRVIDMSTSAVMAVANIAAMTVGAEGATKAAANAIKVAEYAGKSADYAVKLKNYVYIIMKAAKDRGETLAYDAALQIAQDTIGFTMIDPNSGTEDQALTLATNIDPTGLVALGQAFYFTTCNKLKSANKSN